MHDLFRSILMKTHLNHWFIKIVLYLMVVSNIITPYLKIFSAKFLCLDVLKTKTILKLEDISYASLLIWFSRERERERLFSFFGGGGGCCHFSLMRRFGKCEIFKDKIFIYLLIVSKRKDAPEKKRKFDFIWFLDNFLHKE